MPNLGILGGGARGTTPVLPGAGMARRNAPGHRGVEAFAPEMLLPRRPIKSPPLGWTLPVPPRQPYVIATRPRRVVGPTPKMSVGKHPSGLGQMAPIAGAQTPQYSAWTPLENSPGTNPNVGILIPHDVTASMAPGTSYRGDQLEPSYAARGAGKPHVETIARGRYAREPQARRFITQARSSGMWAQTSFSPKQRPLIPSQQPQMLHRTPRRRQIPAHAPNYGLYTIGYPQSVGIAAGLGGGGPVAVLGGMSQ